MDLEVLRQMNVHLFLFPMSYSMYRNSGILGGMLVGRKSYAERSVVSRDRMSISYCTRCHSCVVYFSPNAQSSTQSTYSYHHVHQDDYTTYHIDASGRCQDTNHTTRSLHSEDSLYTRRGNDTMYSNPLPSTAVHTCDIFHCIL